MTNKESTQEERQRSRSSLNAIRDWVRANSDIIKAYVTFIGVTVVGFGVVLADWTTGYLLDPLNHWTAECSGLLVNLFGGNAYVSGNSIGCSLGAVSIAEGCNAVYATIIFLAAIFAFPTSWKKKLIGAGLGSIALFAINLVRIITLLDLSGYNAKLFQEAHLHIWQFAIIIIGGLLWLLWYDKIVRQPSHAKDL